MTHISVRENRCAGSTEVNEYMYCHKSERQTKAGNQDFCKTCSKATLTLFQSLIHSLLTSCFHVYAQKTLSHSLSLTFSLSHCHSHTLSISHSITLDNAMIIPRTRGRASAENGDLEF